MIRFRANETVVVKEKYTPSSNQYIHFSNKTYCSAFSSCSKCGLRYKSEYKRVASKCLPYIINIIEE